MVAFVNQLTNNKGIVVNNTEENMIKELVQYLYQLSDRLDKGSQEYILDLACKIGFSSYNKGWKDYRNNIEKITSNLYANPK